MFRTFLDNLSDLSEKWKDYLEQKSHLPKKGISEADMKKIAL